VEAKWEMLEVRQGEDVMGTAALQEPSAHHVSLPHHPSQAVRVALSLGILKTLARLHWDSGSMPASEREVHVAGMERQAHAELLSMTGGLWLPVT